MKSYTLSIVALLSVAYSEPQEGDTGCPDDNPACRAESEFCGFRLEDSYLALCGDGLYCQGTEMATNDAQMFGTCKSACDGGFIPGNLAFCIPVCQVEDETDSDRLNWFSVVTGNQEIYDLCGNACTCNVENGTPTWDCTSAKPCKPDTPECRDISDRKQEGSSWRKQTWTDSEGNGCTWYEDEPLRCNAFGELRVGVGGLNAEQACCVCGGGEINGSTDETERFFMQRACILETGEYVEQFAEARTDRSVFADECESICTCGRGGANSEGYQQYEVECVLDENCAPPADCTDTQVGDVANGDALVDWQDVNGNDCSWYADDQLRCSLFDAVPGSAGETAFDICCVCGGGTVPFEDESQPLFSLPLILGITSGVLAILLCIFVMLWCHTKKKLEEAEYEIMEGLEVDKNNTFVSERI